MARDEARHGKALKGLLERYFAVEIAKEKVSNTAGKIGDAVSSAAEKIGEAVDSLLKK